MVYRRRIPASKGGPKVEILSEIDSGHYGCGDGVLCYHCFVCIQELDIGNWQPV